MRGFKPKPIRVEAQRAVRASPQRVYQLLSRVEGLPRYAGLWLAADVLERGGAQSVAEFRGYFAGIPVESVQRVTLRPPGRIEFRQVRGTLRTLRGEYIVEADGQGCRLSGRLEAESGVPLLPENSLRMVLANALEGMLSKVKDAAERDLPRLIPRRATTGAGAAVVKIEAAEDGGGDPTAAPSRDPADSDAAAAPAAPEAPAPSDIPRGEAGQTPAPAREGGTSGRRRRRRRHRRRSTPPA